MRARPRPGFDELGGTVRSLHRPVGAMSGGQRQQIAIARAITGPTRWCSSTSRPPPSASSRPRTCWTRIKRVRDKGIAVVLISHSMPHVLEVADRIQVLRLGTRVATIKAAETTVEELVGAMTGALDKKERRHERHHTSPTDVAVADSHTTSTPSRCSKRLANTQSVWILGVLLVIVAFFSIAAGGKFLSASNFSLISRTSPSGPCSASA